MPRKASARRVKTNHAIKPMTEEEQREALNAIAFGEGWTKFQSEIEERLAGIPEDATIRVSVRRALDLIQDMAFERI